jgi:hypothetical protein
LRIKRAKLIRRYWVSALGKTTKYTVAIGAIGKFREVHIGKRKIVFDAPDFTGNDSKGSPRFRVQVYNQDRVIRMREGKPIDDEKKRAVGIGRESVRLPARW